MTPFFDPATPTPPPSWAARIRRRVSDAFDALTGTSPVAEIREQDTISNDYGSDIFSSPKDMAKEWRITRQRVETIETINRMDAEDEFVASALDTIADCSVAYTEQSDAHISIISTDPEVKDILDKLFIRLDMTNEIWQIVRDMVKFAENYREVILDPSRSRIIALKQTVTYDIHKQTNKNGDPQLGWIYKTTKDIAVQNPGKEMEEWQILPFLFGNRVGVTYVPLLAPARRNWMRMQKIEDGMAITRLTRSYDKWVHRVPVKPTDNSADIQAKIRNYINNIGKKKIVGSDGLMGVHNSPFDVDTDFFLPDSGDGRGGITTLSGGNSALNNLNDYYVLRERLFARMSVPIAYMQIMSTQKTHLRAGSMLSDIDVQFARRLRFIQSCLRRGLRRLCDLELQLHGILPTVSMYSIQLTPIVTKDLVQDAKIALTNAQAAVYFVEAFGSLPMDLLSAKFLNLTPDQEVLFNKFMKLYSARLERAKVKQQELAAQPKPAGMPGAKDRIAGSNSSRSGNQNKSRAARSTEQKGAKTQSAEEVIEMGAAVDLFHTMHEQIRQNAEAQGVDIDDIDLLSPAQIEEELQSISDRAIILEAEDAAETALA